VPRFVYVVGFRDDTRRGEGDFNLVACVLLDARSAEEARSWGDHLAKERCARDESLEFISSGIRTQDTMLYAHLRVHGSPVVRYGTHPTDDEIGW